MTCDRCNAEIIGDDFQQTEDYIICEDCVKILTDRSRFCKEVREELEQLDQKYFRVMWTDLNDPRR